MSQIRFGFAGNPKKMHNFFTPLVEFARFRPKSFFSQFHSILHFSRENNIIFLPIDIETNSDMISQPDVQVLFQKITDDMVKAKYSPESTSRVQNLENYVQIQKRKNPNFVLVEDLNAIRQLLDRAKMYDLLKRSCNIQISDFNIQTPNYAVFDRSTDLDWKNHLILKKQISLLVQNQNIQFPSICKTVVACGTRNSHIMAIIFSEDDLFNLLQQDSFLNPDFDFLNEPILVQPFLNHDATVFKVFVINRETIILSRPSLKNLSNGNSFLLFNSQHEMPEALKPNSPLIDPSSLPLEKIKILSQNIADIANLKLFGYDIIRDGETFHIVDINYLPSYRGVEGVQGKILDYLQSLVK